MILWYLPGQSPDNFELMRRVFTIKWEHKTWNKVKGKNPYVNFYDGKIYQCLPW